MIITRNLFVSWLALTATVAAGCANDTSPEENGTGLAVRIESLEAGSGRIEYSLVNHTAEPVHVLRWKTALDEMPDQLFEISRDGVAVQYRGPILRRVQPDSTDYVEVAPGQRLYTTVDLTQLYDVQTSGTYDVQLRTIEPSFMIGNESVAQRALQDVDRRRIDRAGLAHTPDRERRAHHDLVRSKLDGDARALEQRGPRLSVERTRERFALLDQQMHASSRVGRRQLEQLQCTIELRGSQLRRQARCRRAPGADCVLQRQPLVVRRRGQREVLCDPAQLLRLQRTRVARGEQAPGPAVQARAFRARQLRVEHVSNQSVREADLAETTIVAVHDAERERSLDAGRHACKRLLDELSEQLERKLAAEHGCLAQQALRRFVERVEVALDRALDVQGRQRLQQLRPRFGIGEQPCAY